MATQDTRPMLADERPERGVTSYDLKTDRETVFSVYNEHGTRVLRAVIPFATEHDREFFADLAEQWLSHCEGRQDTRLRLIG